MMPAVICGFLAGVMLACVIWLCDLLIFRTRREREFARRKTDAQYLAQLIALQKKCRHPQKKNYLLFLIIRSLSARGEEKRAESLRPFLRSDGLLGVKKEA